MDKKKLKTYKETLLQAKAAVLKELQVEQEYMVYNDEGDLVDIADSHINNQLINRLSDMDRERLALIDSALVKIEGGNYGICEGTGKPIPEARLKAIPWTPYTREHAEELEKRARTIG